MLHFLAAVACFVLGCAAAARILRDYLEHWEGTT